MKDEILEYIRTHVTQWPEGAKNVRLDGDGEICFFTDKDDQHCDFRPHDEFKGRYVGESSVGNFYTREQWQQPTHDAKIIDDIEALCLSIETRQNELTQLVKKLKVKLC
jgi:hypothetical protein